MSMMPKIFVIVYSILTGGKNRIVYRALFIFLFVSPIVTLAIINYLNLNQDTTRSILAERRSLSILTAATVSANLNNLLNLGVSYATRPRVIEYIEKGDWASALNIMTLAMELFPYFDRIVLFDPKGVIKADMPVAIPSVTGQNRADREWYSGVKRSWKPYISGVYIRGAEPKIPVISVVVPIKTMSTTTKADYSAAEKDQKVIGILQLQIKLDVFSKWISKINIGQGGIIYIVDQYGRIVYHPKYINERTLTDFSSVGVVVKVLKGIGGAEINYNPIEEEERLAAYEPVPSYGWGVVVTQSTAFAFIEKNSRMKFAVITYAIIIFLTGAIAVIVLYIFTINKRAEETLRESEQRYRELSIVDGLTQLYNSRHFYVQLKSETERSNRYGQPLTLLLFDLDDFKRFNDTYGHIEGDQVLLRLGQMVKRCLRKADSAYRYGGEEFIILLPMTTGEDAAITAERIRMEFKKETFSPVPGQDVHMTVSIGLAQYKPQEDMKVFVQRVDQLMYQGKKNGKDRVCAEP